MARKLTRFDFDAGQLRPWFHTSRQVRSTVIGDGARTFAALFAERLAAAEPKDMAGLAKAAAGVAAEELARIPAAGEAVAVQWKHNLGQGAAASLDVGEEVPRRYLAGNCRIGC